MNIKEYSYEECVSYVNTIISDPSIIPSQYYIVFDLDYTLLSDDNLRKRYKSKNDVFKMMYLGIHNPIQSMVSLYKRLQSLGFKMIIITGRRTTLRAATEKNLSKIGITYDSLIMKGNNVDTVAYKTEQRKCIEASGLKILINIGDQIQDLQGGYSIHCIKIPSVY